MKYNLFFITFLICILSACSAKKTLIQSPADLNKEAMDFSLSVIQMYIDNDCKSVYASMNDTILTLDGDGSIPRTTIESKICFGVDQAIKDKTKTLQDYLDTYKVEILTATEIETRFKTKLPDYFDIEGIFLFFIGFEFREGKSKKDNFIWDDMFVFMLTKEAGVWTIKGLDG